ncbi:MAG: DUF2218 domain-containing protein [Pelagimonas sp.]|jgi:hypothetical protein|nr:DUF2218 domain-containing protein [Pelagimonas sp.]
MPHLTEIGVFKTPHAGKYIQQLCKHFAHKVPVEFDATKGHADLPTGPAKMIALKDALRIEITGKDQAALVRARFIIDSHLERFAFREDFKTMRWQSV